MSAGTTALPALRATRYVTPLREGGSLPGLVEAEDDGLYVAKFHGAGQGPGALVAEVVGGELARAIGLRVPDLVRLDIDPALARAEPDPEIQELIAASAGINLGVDFLPGALPFTAGTEVDPAFAADVVWLDALITNVDRTPRNPNLLVWHGRTWLIDHGAAMFRQHATTPLSETATAPFPMVAQHVLLEHAEPLARADERLAEPALAAIEGVLEQVPAEWLGADPDDRRADLARFLRDRLAAPRAFVEEAEHARG